MGKNNSKLNPEDLTDLKLTTRFNNSEIKQWYKSFMKEYPSGRLDKRQFKAMYKDLFPEGDETKFVELAFKRFDVDGDGFVDFREFMLAMSINTRGNVEERLEWAFSTYDIDGDGSITSKEMLEIVRSIQKMVGDTKGMIDNITPEKRVEKIFAHMDVDGDGSITKEEFIRGAKSDNSFMALLSIN